jgi:FixJ family two-component response regulator
MKGCRARITIAPLRERVDRILLLRAALLQEISQAFLLFSASFPMRAQRSRPTVVRVSALCWSAADAKARDRTDGGQQAELACRPAIPIPCCLVLDVTLPGVSGLELQEQLGDRTDMPIIFITGHGDVSMTVQAMKAGAVEFLTKPFNDAVLLDAIRSAIQRSRIALREESQMQVLRSCHASLSPREREVMALVVLGLLNKQIGGELGIAEITVKAHRGQLMRKMKADSLPALVTMASKLGLRTAPMV